MAHQVLARKYRPQRFADVAGQQHVTVTLMNALTQGRIAHGYIFSGHRGIGKTTIARILAMGLNCRNTIGSTPRPTAEPCGQCESCTEIRSGNAVDVIEIDAATNRGIDEIRELRDAARYRPARDKYKIYILDEAHQITDAAFNALLKTLEEPPEHIVFMMATTQPEDIPQTVRSRCQHFSFHAVKMADILQELRTIADREEVSADETALGLLAEAGDGSMRDALSIMDQAIASAPVEGSRARLDAAQIRELMGTVSNAIFERMLDAVDEGRSAEVIAVANELLDAGNSPAQLARQSAHYLRNCLMAKIAGLTVENSDGNTSDLLQISPDEQRRAARTASKFSEEELTRFLQVMLRTFDELGYRQEQRFHFELGLLKLVHLRRLLPMEEVLSRLPQNAPAVKGPGTPRPALPAKAVFTSTHQAAPSRDRISPVTADRTEPDSSTVPGNPTGSNSAVADSAPLSSPPGERPSGEPGRHTIPVVATTTSDEDATGEDRVSGEREIQHDRGGPAQVPAISALALVETDLKDTVHQALSKARSQGSAADAMDEAEWTVSEESIRIQTTLSSTMLPLVVNAEAEKILRGALHRAGFDGKKVEILPGKPPEREAKSPPRARSGTAQAKAEQHPIVQQAQKLFHAEIRKVIDLTEGK